MSKLRNKIREASQRPQRSFGFVRRDEAAASPRVLVMAEVENAEGAARAVETGAGALLLTEEALSDDDGRLAARIAHQPPWSDLPVLLLTRSSAVRTTRRNCVRRRTVATHESSTSSCRGKHPATNGGRNTGSPACTPFAPTRASVSVWGR